MTFGELLTDLRTEKNYTQQELSDVLNVSRPTISNYESDVHYPDIENLIKIADFFEMSLDYLLGRIQFRVDFKMLNHLYFRSNDKNDAILTGDILKKILELSNPSREKLIDYMNLLQLQDKS